MNSTTNTRVPTVNITINAMKHRRSITAAASIHSRLILASLSDFCLSSSSVDILVSSRLNISVIALMFEAPPSAGCWRAWTRSPSPRRWFFGSRFLFLPSTLDGSVILLNERREASRLHISCLAWKKQNAVLYIVLK